MKRRRGALKEGTGTVPKIDMVNLLRSIPQRHLWPCIRVTVHWGKGNDQNFEGLLDSGSELLLSPGDPEYHCSPLVGAGA